MCPPEARSGSQLREFLDRHSTKGPGTQRQGSQADLAGRSPLRVKQLHVWVHAQTGNRRPVDAEKREPHQQHEGETQHPIKEDLIHQATERHAANA